jgi:MFS family permease
MSFGGPWITAVGLKAIAADMGGARTVPSLATSLAWFGAAAGGIVMGNVANRYGIRWTVIFGSTMICVGLFVSTLGQPWELWLGHGLFMGLLGNAGLNAPLYVYVSRWFDRRRGSALALISSGGYLAGFVWPTIFERAIAWYGWRWTMIGYAILQLAVILPLAIIYLKPPPELPAATGTSMKDGGKPKVFGWNANVVFALLAFASFLCCVTMSMPQQHLVAFCSDLGISATSGAAMLSLLLGMGFFSRQAWGWVSDRMGGLLTALTSSALQGAAMTGFLLTQDEAGLFTVATLFGLGFSALIPAYVLAIRELYPVSEAHWRVPTLLFLSGSGMATGGWLAGYLYDIHGYYAPAFATGVAFNVANLALLSMLVIRQRAYAR